MLAISMSFQGAPQWLLGDCAADVDLSLHLKMTTPRGPACSRGQQSPEEIHSSLHLLPIPPDHRQQKHLRHNAPHLSFIANYSPANPLKVEDTEHLVSV